MEQTLLNVNNSEQIEYLDGIEEEAKMYDIQFLYQSNFKCFIYGLTILLSGGLFYLISRWFNNIQIKMIYSPLHFKTNRRSKIYIRVTTVDNEYEIIECVVGQMLIDGVVNDVYRFKFRLYDYYVDQDYKIIGLGNYFEQQQSSYIIDNYGKGLSSMQVEQQANKYGRNVTDIKQKSIMQIFVDEVLSPFQIFQVVSILIWLFNHYQFYACIILVTSLISIILTLIESKEQQDKIRNMSQYSCNVNVIRDGCKLTIDSAQLVVGDLIEIPQQCIMPCDIILLNGSCIVNESILTGESIPVLKNQLENNHNKYTKDGDNKNNTLFAGTFCIETRYYQKEKYQVMGIVNEVAFQTVKGQLIRTILFPKQIGFKFYRDCMKFILLFFIIGMFGFSYSVYTQVKQHMKLKDILFQSLDIITVTVPPALPTCMSIGIIIGLNQLKKFKIFCTSPQRINVAGRINIMCFDKTGTLTEDGLDTHGVVVIDQHYLYNEHQKQNGINQMSLKVVKDGHQNKYNINNSQQIYQLEQFRDQQLNQVMLGRLINNDEIKELNGLKDQRDKRKIISDIMGCCHSLTTVNGELIGDPLELKMFESSDLVLEDNNKNQYDDLLLSIVKHKTDKDYQQIGIMRRFDFSSSLQRMSVIVKYLGQQNFTLYVKGSPEKLRELCIAESIPYNFHQILDFYAQNGYRVLACGYKNIKISYMNLHKVERQKLENKLTFVGFIVMANKLKKITVSTIKTLQKAQIRNIMVTGDNILTALSVSRQCGIIQKDQNIYLGEEAGLQIRWKDFYFSDNVLDVSTMKENQKLVASKKVFTSRGELMQLDNEEQEESCLVFNETISRIDEQIQNTSQQRIVNDCVLPKDTNYALAINGKMFNLLQKEEHSQLLKVVLDKCQVYARMKPDDKQLLVQLLQKNDDRNIVGMCGDGANDCGALKMADVGVSLSEAEASIAAPFTSKVQDISCIIQVLREGRCCLTTAFQCFKYMTLYSMIQFVTVSILHSQNSDLGDQQYTYVDVIILLPLAGLMSYTKSNPRLSKRQPPSSLMTFPILASVIGHIIIELAFQILIYVLLQQQKWYVSCLQLIHSDVPDDYYNCYENNVLFLFANFQYIMTGLVFSLGKPFKKQIYTNVPFIVTVVVLMVSCGCITFFSLGNYMNRVMNVLDMISFKYVMMLVMLINSLFTYIYEVVIVPKLSYRHKSNI